MSIWTILIVVVIYIIINAGSFIVGAKARFAKNSVGPQVDRKLRYASYIGFIGFYFGNSLAKKAIRKGKTSCKVIHRISKDYPRYGIILD